MKQVKKSRTCKTTCPLYLAVFIRWEMRRERKYQHMTSVEKLGYSRAEMIYLTLNEGVE